MEKDIDARLSKNSNPINAQLKPVCPNLAELAVISNILITFESVEITLPAILVRLADTLSLRSVVLIEQKKESLKTSIWHTPDATKNQIIEAQSYAEKCYHYLEGSPTPHLIGIPASSVPINFINKQLAAQRVIPHIHSSFIAFPLVVANGSIFGVLQLECTIKGSEKDLAYMNILTNLIAAALNQYQIAQNILKLHQQQIQYWTSQLDQSKQQITALVKMEQKLHSAIDRRDNIISICGHEFQTPLSSLRLQTQAIKRGISTANPSVYLPDSVQQLIKVYETQVERLIRLTSDMLDTSQINAGKLCLNLEQVNLSDVVYKILAEYSDELNAKGYIVHLSLATDAIGTWDRFRIEQVLINLLTNAIRYGKKRPINISISKYKHHAAVKIRDQGAGIATENLERIFHRFEQAIFTQETNGVGLGLFIVRELLNLHGGSISVKSKLNQGSTFIVKLPLI